ncbi:MAG: class I SAM-dependent methyltransferase [Pseudomonadota bacterium]|nr:class I SAM-dependent methyltransferase [Pseudomonadota bacterium]
MTQEGEEKAYTQAHGTGRYEKASGLTGKYDNVRRFWEDKSTAIFLRPALNNLVERKRRELERIRILDLGCGSADGYDLLMNVTTKDPGLFEYVTDAITPDMLQEYVGTDINADLLQQAEEHIGHLPKTRFIQTDMSNGLASEVTENPPFDMYFSSYGTFSHFNDQQAAKIITDIARHAPDQAIFIGDWLGRYTCEWQDLWHHPADEEYFMDYRISYIYSEDERDQMDIASFPLRLTTKDEIMKIIEQASKESGVTIEPIKFFDRSIFSGRHMDTREYNANSPKLRYPLNSLFEGYVRTDLENLLVDYVPRPGFDHLNNFYEKLFMCSNTLVNYTISLLSNYDAEDKVPDDQPKIMPYYPDSLKEVMETMYRVIKGIGWVPMGDVRANLIEPHLGYSLRKLEMDLQPGTGFGHGIVGIFEIKK